MPVVSPVPNPDLSVLPASEVLLFVLHRVRADLERATQVCCLARQALSEAPVGPVLGDPMSSIALDASVRLDAVREAIAALEARGDAGVGQAARVLKSLATDAKSRLVPAGAVLH